MSRKPPNPAGFLGTYLHGEKGHKIRGAVNKSVGLNSQCMKRYTFCFVAQFLCAAQCNAILVHGKLQFYEENQGVL